MEAVAKFEYTTTADDELSFKKGDQMRILGTTDDWFKAEMCGSEGFVPMNYIDIHLPSWYQENASRAEAQDSLMSKPLGSFIIRGSQSTPGDFSISVRHELDVQHFKVKTDSRRQYYVWNDKFPSLNKLVEFYKRNSLSKTSSVCLLEAEPVPNQHPAQTLPSAPSHHPDPIPPPLPAPPPLEQVKALYDFVAEEKDELDFSAGDIIEVLERSDVSWWSGRLRGRTGLFPSNYTTPV